MRATFGALALIGLAAVCGTHAEDATEPRGPTIIPMLRSGEGRLAQRRDLLRRSDEGLAVLKEGVTEEQIKEVMTSHFHKPQRNVTGSIKDAIKDGIEDLLDKIRPGDADEEEEETEEAEEVPADGKRRRLRRAFGASKHGKQRRQLAQISSTIATVNNNYDCLYFTNIQLGTPGVSYTVIIDTGSSDLWVPSPWCGSCGNRKRYNPAASTTSQSLGMAVTSYYGLGSAWGNIFTDNARFGNLAVTGQVFIAANGNSNVQPAYVDGLMGMGFSGMSWANSVVPWAYVGKSSLVENLYKQGKISRPTFGIWLDRYVSWSAEPSTVVGGELAIGGPAGNTARYTGAVTWLDVPNYTGWWSVEWRGISGPDGINLKPARGIRGLVDTGTALIVMDYAVAAKLNTFIGGYSTGIRGLWAINCNTIAASPIQFTINLQGYNFVLTGKDLPSRVWPTNGSVCYSPFQSSASSDVLGQWLIGDVFLRKFYQIYDYNYAGGHPRVGLALALH
ncbi:Vacuolar protease A [Geranomyces variabilis]|nr:Vacuolar protease A [Geranomyces variabilis]